jgi:hypothetical protein
MTRTLKGMNFIKSLSVAEGVYSGLFEDEHDNNSKVIAIWSPSEDKEVAVEVNSDKVKLINTVGEITELKAVTKELKKFVNVQLKKGSPAYIK